MIWLLIYVAICISIGVTFCVFAWGNGEGNAPIVMASILVAFVWPLIVPAWIYVEIDDHIAERRFDRMLRRARK